MFDRLFQLLETETFSSALLGATFAFLFTGIAWFLKISYEKRSREYFNIGKLERIFVMNLSVLMSHICLLDQWKSALQQHIEYSCRFSRVTVDDAAHLSIGDMKLVKLLVKANLNFGNVNDDIESFYTEYKRSWTRFLDEKIDTNAIQQNESYFIQQIDRFIKKILEIQDETIRVLAYLKLYGNTKKYSLFQVLNVLHWNIWPRVTEKMLEKKIIEIKIEIKRKTKNKSNIQRK